MASRGFAPSPDIALRRRPKQERGRVAGRSAAKVVVTRRAALPETGGGGATPGVPFSRKLAIALARGGARTLSLPIVRFAGEPR